MERRANLEKFRKSLGLTIEQMADELGYTRSYLNDIELGKKIGSVEFWQRFQAVFGIKNHEMWDFVVGGA